MAPGGVKQFLKQEMNTHGGVCFRTTSNLRPVVCVQPLRRTAGAEYAYMYGLFSLFAVILFASLFLLC